MIRLATVPLTSPILTPLPTVVAAGSSITPSSIPVPANLNADSSLLVTATPGTAIAGSFVTVDALTFEELNAESDFPILSRVG